MERWLVWGRDGWGWHATSWTPWSLEGPNAREVARAHGISKSWIYELIARYHARGLSSTRAPVRELTLDPNHDNQPINNT
jgi:hypothetical protein